MKKGFTLAEVLITLAVIGVIATLTLPGAITNHQQRVMLAQLQKTYNQVANAISQAMTDESVSSITDLSWYGWTASKNANLKNFLQRSFATSVICDQASGFAKCTAPKYSNWKKTESKTFDEILTDSYIGKDAMVCVVINTGATICLRNRNVVVDVNGPQTPNVIGKDLFWFDIANDGRVAASANDINRLGNPSTYDSARVVFNKEANGDFCFGEEFNLKRVGCLQYIISHGWKMK